MALTTISRRQFHKKKGLSLWFERLMAMIVIVNYFLVIFNLTYIPLRDFWLEGRVQLFFKFGKHELEWPEYPVRVLPVKASQFITHYDIFKGIEPYRSTEQYLNDVQNFKTAVALEGLNNPNETIDKLLLDLQAQSIEMIETNPFQVANKTGTLERIKNKMRRYVFPEEKKASAKQAFKVFWTRDFLQDNYLQKIKFFDREIVHLINTNYYRSVGENGQPVDNFGLIDFSFFLIFLPEFLIRTWWISRRYTGVSWIDAMLWRWYDIFLLIPVLRFLRIIPLMIRLDQAELIDLRIIKRQASQGFVGAIAGDVTEFVVVEIINQLQTSVKKGDIPRFLSPKNHSSYIDVNEINEIAEIIKLFFNVIVEKTLPKIQPEAEAFLKYNFEQALSQSPAYKNLQRLPGIEGLQNQLSQQLANRTYTTICEIMNSMVKDQNFNELLGQVIQKFTQTMGNELRGEKSTGQLEFLITELLEEIKINYIERLSQENIEAILEQTRQLRQKSQATQSQIEVAR